MQWPSRLGRLGRPPQSAPKSAPRESATAVAWAARGDFALTNDRTDGCLNQKGTRRNVVVTVTVDVLILRSKFWTDFLPYSAVQALLRRRRLVNPVKRKGSISLFPPPSRLLSFLCLARVGIQWRADEIYARKFCAAVVDQY